MKIKRNDLRKLIMQEFSKIEEDSLRSQYDDKDRQSFYQRKKSSEKSCGECGSSMYEDDAVCEQCGSMYEEEVETNQLKEGNCGCSSKNDGTDYSTDSMGMIKDVLGTLTINSKDMHMHDKRHHNNYMAKPALYKVAKYAQKLLDMIPDGYELDDWQRTKIAQISDDISEVYHSLDYDKFEGDL